MNDRDLLAECLKGIEEAWQEFVPRFEPLIAGMVAGMAKKFGHVSPDLVRDLTQDVFLKLCRRECNLLRDLRLQHDYSLRSYLKRVAISVSLDYFAKCKQDLDAVELDEGLAGGRASSSAIEKEILLKEVQQIVDKITAGPNAERDRQVFWLYHLKGFTAKAIAAIPDLNLKQKGVESVLSRIKISLRNELRRMRRTESLSAKTSE